MALKLRRTQRPKVPRETSLYVRIKARLEHDPFSEPVLLCYHITPSPWNSLGGFPDLLILWSGRYLLCELKMAGSKPDKRQRLFAKAIKYATGQEVLLLTIPTRLAEPGEIASWAASKIRARITHLTLQ